MKQQIIKRVTENEGLIGFINCYLIIMGYRDIMDPNSSQFSVWWGWTIMAIAVYSSIPFFKKLILGR